MAMTKFSGWNWLLIDAANQYGMDKELFEDRIEWATVNLNDLESLAGWAETKPLYLKACMAIRKAQAGLPTGHLVGVDACCSGIQVMSALTGCIAGATATGLVDPDVRADAYAKTTEVMNDILGGGLVVSRADAKQALMTSFYGSKEEPKKIFGEDTPELNAFYQAAQQVAPGAWELLQDLLASWQPYALVHQWKLPDGFDARIKVMKKIDGKDPRSRIEVDELDHATFTYEFYENEGSRKGLSNAANVVHSMDAYILRAMHRRCNYDRAMVEKVAGFMELELLERLMDPTRYITKPTGKAAYYVEQYQRSTLADVVILPYLDSENVQSLSQAHLEALMGIVQGMLTYKPFELVTVHDEYRCLANNVNHVRYQYKEILAEIADSNVLDDLLSQLHGVPGHFPKLSTGLGDLIRQSSYGLC